MKTGSIIFSALSLTIMFLSPPVFADTDTPSGKVMIQIQGGPDFPLFTNIPSSTRDWIGECLIGYSIDKNVTVGLLSGYRDYFSDNGTSVINGIGIDNKYSYAMVPLEAVIQYSVGGNKLRPYFLLGVGLSFDSIAFNQTLTSSGNVSVYQSPFVYSTDPLIEPGLGFSYQLLDNFNAFVQSKLTIDFLGGAIHLYLPVQLGCNISI